MNKLIKGTLIALSVLSFASCGNGNGNSSKWTVSFMLNNGTEDVYKTIEVENGNTVGSITDPTRNGYTFAGWYVDKDCKVYFDEIAEKITADTKLYASWANSGLSGTDSKGESSENETSEEENSSENQVASLPGTTEAPTSGFALLFNDTNYVALESLGDEKDFQGRDQYVAYAVSVAEGQVFKCYDGSSKASWVEKVLEPYGVNESTTNPCFTVTDDGIKCLVSGTYDIYVKMKWEDNTIYIGQAA